MYVHKEEHPPPLTNNFFTFPDSNPRTDRNILHISTSSCISHPHYIKYFVASQPWDTQLPKPAIFSLIFIDFSIYKFSSFLIPRFNF